MCWRPARRTPSANLSKRLSRAWDGTWIGVAQASMKKASTPARAGADRDRPPLFPAHRGRYLAGRSLQGAPRLGWRHKTSFDDLVKEMVDADLAAGRHEKERKNRHD